MSNVITMIPTRMAAARFPNKPLRDINGKSMIRRVYENVCNSTEGDVVIAVGDQILVDHCKEFGARVVLTDPNLPSGTDRIAAALKEVDPRGDKYDYIVNFQGDGINVDPKINSKLVDLMKKTNADLTTAAMITRNEKEIADPNYVKIAMGLKDGEREGRCLYFSRAAVPFTRDPSPVREFDSYHHIGIYCFNPVSLQRMVTAPEGILENRERLEQLRLLEMGMTCHAVVVDSLKLISEAPADINTEEEYIEALKWIK